ncbi:patatin-like phospholipase family protein [Natronomonas salina]|uniref:patatin-like phospholipase family protein n=1 Tax=Natronomonas salina TaxID=1710540 RepID=UPI0015B542CD|nr:patatin-like phospholipase family protein [Natronomonas salina]QLD88673.1 patatin-like phospholipase family protein [Natronomonas salina]
MSNVAIACQGGGSHTAFTAGVLQHALENWDEDDELVGLSGTSGGALNAVVAWYGLVTEGRERAVELLDDVWDDVAAGGPADRMANAAFVWTRRVEASGFPVPQVSPYFRPTSPWREREFRALVERHVDFEAIRALADDPERPELVVGTVDVNAGEFETFTNREVTADAVLASAAVPTLFRAVEIDGHYHWDGLFSQNPPVHDLVTAPEERQPDELWVVQIEPQAREEEPTSLEEITDRRNELSGNISLNQELGFIERVNRWIDEGHLSEERFSRTEIHRVQLRDNLEHSSKVDRSPAFVEDLMDRGRARAAEFLASR